MIDLHCIFKKFKPLNSL